MANTLTVEQSYAVLNAVVEQATGAKQIMPTNTNEFVTVAQIGLKCGYDQLVNAISQVLTRTLFAIRPYSRKFAGLMADSAKYGNHVRKINLVDGEAEKDESLASELIDGASVDQYKIKKPRVVQTNFYGAQAYQVKRTFFKNQLDVAFSSAEEFGRFIAMEMTQISNEIEKYHEEMARGTVANFIAGKKMCDSDNVIYLLDAYEDETGLSGLTPDVIKQPENFAPFVKWLFGYLKTKSDLLTEYSVKFHKNFVDADSNPVRISRHTPLANQKLYVYSKELNNMDSSVLSSTFHDEYLKIMDHERVNFWQAIDTPMGIDVKPSYNAADGSIVENPANVVMSNVFAVLFDEEAMGYTVVNEWSQATPMNAAGGYYNIFYHFTDRYWNDFTENGVVLILDHSDAALKSLAVTSEAGSTAGKTAVTVSPAKGASNSYVYKVGDAPEVMSYGKDLSAWTDWDGSAEITAATGKILNMAEVDSNDKAVGFGFAVVESLPALEEKKAKK